MTDRGSAQNSTAERITIGLLPKVAEELEHLKTGSGSSKTDIINRAITLYAFVMAQLDNGHELLLRDPEHGVDQRIKLL